MVARKQKNFENVPESIQKLWTTWLEKVGASNQAAGPVAMYMLTLLDETAWGAARARYNKFIAGEQTESDITSQHIPALPGAASGEKTPLRRGHKGRA